MWSIRTSPVEDSQYLYFLDDEGTGVCDLPGQDNVEMIIRGDFDPNDIRDIIKMSVGASFHFYHLISPWLNAAIPGEGSARRRTEDWLRRKAGWSSVELEELQIGWRQVEIEELQWDDFERQRYVNNSFLYLSQLQPDFSTLASNIAPSAWRYHVTWGFRPSLSLLNFLSPANAVIFYMERDDFARRLLVSAAPRELAEHVK